MAVTARYTKNVQVNMTVDTWEEVKRLSDEEGVSKAEIVRRALEAGLPTIRSEQSGNTPLLD